MPATVSPDTVALMEVGFVIVALLVVVHIPLPIAGDVAFNVAVPGFAQTD